MAEQLVLPGGVDVHVHLREPGLNKSETIANGTRAAMMGGFVFVADMPNNPGNPTWTAARMLEKRVIADRGAVIPIGFHAGSQPESDNLSELAGMARTATGLKLYGAPTTGNERDYEARDFEKIVKEWHRVAPNKPILLHAGKENLADMIELVADVNGHALHICHVNDTAEVKAVADAKQDHLEVTCGVCPHHLFKSSHDVKSQGWLARMMPPLARQDVSEELWDMLVDGHVDLVETDYAPHSIDAKLQAEHANPAGVHDHNHTTCFGVPGIEHVMPMLIRQQQLGTISLERLVEVSNTAPLKLLRLEADPRTKVVWDLEEFMIEQTDVLSGAEWTPYIGSLGIGRVAQTVINGRTIYDREAA